MQIGMILANIDLGNLALPEFQRGFVWNGSQVRALMDSLYRSNPVGTLLVWDTTSDNAKTRGSSMGAPGSISLLLDGQQRISSLYGIIRGNPPPFFEGNANAFLNLYFNMESETFEFYGPVRMRDNPRWVSVTKVMQEGITPFVNSLFNDDELKSRAEIYVTRLTKLNAIQNIEIHIDQIVGTDKSVDEVVDIFNRVNSSGTKLSSGDLALAKMCVEWEEARAELNGRIERWKSAGFSFKLDLLIRCLNSNLTGEASFSHLSGKNEADLRDGLIRTERHIDYLINLMSSRLGLDHSRVLGSRYAFPLLVRYLEMRGGRIRVQREQERLLFWYVHTMLWGRYSGSTESTLAQDLQVIRASEGAVERLVENIRRDRGDLKVAPEDFRGSTVSNRFYPFLYMLTRIHHAKDWGTGVELANHMLGSSSSLQLHHVFPKSVLRDSGYDKNQVNALANFTFLTQATNLNISNKLPADYLPSIVENQPGALESHWIPMEPELWKVESYPEFLEERRRLLASAANEFLDVLFSGSTSAYSVTDMPIEERQPAIDIVDEEEQELLLNTSIWIAERGLPEGEFAYELIDLTSGRLTAVLDLAWPEGLQQGLSQPVALLIDEDAEVEKFASQAGFAVYTDAESLKSYVRRDIISPPLAAD